MKWRDRRLLDLFGIEHPLVQAPMAGLSTPQMAIAASKAGGLGSIAAAMLTPETVSSDSGSDSLLEVWSISLYSMKYADVTAP